MSAQIVRLKSIDQKLCALDAGPDALNTGGLIELYCLLPSDVSAYPSYSFDFDSTKEAKASGTIDLLSSSEVYQFRFTEQSGSFTENTREEDDGVYYEQTITIAIPKDHPSLIWVKHAMRRRRYLFIYRDGNKQVKLINKLDEPSRVKFDLNTGAASADTNLTNLTIIRSSLEPAIFWDIPNSDAVTDHINIP